MSDPDRHIGPARASQQRGISSEQAVQREAGAVAPESTLCPICAGSSEPLGVKLGRYADREFLLRHCPECHFSFVENPWTELAAIYSADYYAGCGADPYVDYVFELEHPAETVRVHEWRGITRAVGSLRTLEAGTRWLDYGCGNGGLVRYLQKHTRCDAMGFEEGWIAGRARDAGIPILHAGELDRMGGTLDIVTAIEVLEHVDRPLELLKRIHWLLKPGGLFFFTTGNAQPMRGKLLSWRYVVPEIHISFFEPQTAAHALRAAGFEPEFRGMLPGYSEIIRFKALKALGVRRLAAWQSLLPWPLLVRLLDARLGITAHPVGRKPNQ